MQYAIQYICYVNIIVNYTVSTECDLIYLVQPHRQPMQPARPRAQRTSP